MRTACRMHHTEDLRRRFCTTTGSFVIVRSQAARAGRGGKPRSVIAHHVTARGVVSADGSMRPAAVCAAAAIAAAAVTQRVCVLGHWARCQGQ